MLLLILLKATYWLQTDWSGRGTQLYWDDTTKYFMSENIDVKNVKGELRLVSPSGKWFSPIKLPCQEITVISAADTHIYGGGGYDSAYIFKLDKTCEKLKFVKKLPPPKVTSLYILRNRKILIGTENGILYMMEDTTIRRIKEFGARIYCIYQPKEFDWVYLGAGDRIWISRTEGETWEFQHSTHLPHTREIRSIYCASSHIFYAATKSHGNQGEIFHSLDDGLHWELLYTFPNTTVAYSICEDNFGNLYVSTGHKGKIFSSSDSGKTWKKHSTPALFAEFYTIIYDSNNILYVGGEIRGRKAPRGVVFRSKDRGRSWDTLFISKRPTSIYSIHHFLGNLLIGGDTNVIFKSGYVDSGWLISSIYDAFKNQPTINKSLKFKPLRFKGKKDICIRIRSSNHPDSMPDWGDCVPNDSNPINYGSAKNGDRYIQYKVEMKAPSFEITPILDEIYIKYLIDVSPPKIIEAVAFDGQKRIEGIDDDDYILIHFSEPTNTPRIESSNIDKVLKLSNNHSWRSDSGRGIIKKPGKWLSPCSLKIYLSTLKIGVGEGHPPTIEIGDTIYPDSATIKDKWDNPVVHPCVITGTFYTGIEETQKQKNKIEIYPTPFYRDINIKYTIEKKTRVKIIVYDICGRIINTFNENKDEGEHILKIDIINSGVYFIKINFDDKHIKTQKIIRI